MICPFPSCIDLHIRACLCLSFLSQANFQLAIITENMIPDVVYHLYSDNVEIKFQCSSAIFKCAKNKQASDMVREAHGLEQLVAIAKDKNTREDKALLAAATGAIWMCAIDSSENVRQLDNVSLRCRWNVFDCRLLIFDFSFAY